MADGDSPVQIPIVAYHEEGESVGDGELVPVSVGDGVGSGLGVGLEVSPGQLVQAPRGLVGAPGVAPPVGCGVGVG